MSVAGGAAARLLTVLLVVTGAAVAAPARSFVVRTDPRSAVLVVLAGIVLLGISRKALDALRARQALRRLSSEDVTSIEVLRSAHAGRAAMSELARLQATAANSTVRDAAARGLLTLWANDELVAEEEKAIASRLFSVRWHVRRRYPRGLRRPIPVAATFGLEGVDPAGPIRPESLQWSYRVMGARRAALELSSPWTAGATTAAWEVETADFDSAGPHRVVLEARLRYEGSGGRWELTLPPSAWTFELDPRLDVAAILASPDEEVARLFQRSIQLVANRSPEPEFRAVDPGFALSDLPGLSVAAPLPYDIAHQASIELEGLASTIAASPVIHRAMTPPGDRAFPGFEPSGIPIFEGPGEYRMRLVLTPDPELAWGTPDLRALWPGVIATDWLKLRVVRL